ncbi:MAG: TIGR02757 family protein [Deferribacteraceae bacterium]|jgi:uncharacterized protein (TIGR02757 family)|nr:TIGR02757 family protein [Deferribacteraceae bacterium]
MVDVSEKIDFFEYLYAKYNTPDYIKTDPIFFPHNLSGNREFTAFTAALFAYGNVKAMQNFLKDYFSSTGTDPFNPVLNGRGIKYRFQSAADVKKYAVVMQKAYEDFGSLENLFLESSAAGGIYSAAEKAFHVIRTRYLSEKPTHGLSFLFALPNRSASKRLNMFLRWMVRQDVVDFGLWKGFRKEELSIPLDTHIHRLCVNLRVIEQGSKGVCAVKKVNAFFRELSPDDPAKYDFALTRLGIAKGCAYEPSPACALCEEKDICAFR